MKPVVSTRGVRASPPRKGCSRMRAIISVSDKAQIDVLGRGLAEMGVVIYSTGGTQQVLSAAGIPVRPVSDLTGFPEILGGRVKTLHPAVHAGILARRDVPTDLAALSRHKLLEIDMVIVNLYPFEATASDPNVSLEGALEQIDIGGATLLRSAAKNFLSVLPVCDPADYGMILEALEGPDPGNAQFRRRLAAKAFRHTSAYDAVIAGHLAVDDGEWPEEMVLGLRKVQGLRYGENPHQPAAFYAHRQAGVPPSGLVAARQLQGKPLSYNNILDGDAAWEVVRDCPSSTAAIVKHTNPCGLGRADDPVIAYELALEGDPLAAFGGVVALNAPLDARLARRIVERFYEIVLAPAIDEEALALFAAKASLRVLELPHSGRPGLSWRSVAGGLLVQESDSVDEIEVRQARVVTSRSPEEDEWSALGFAWRAVRHVKSNAIVLVRGGSASRPGSMGLVGMGAGQPSRVAAVEIAMQRAGQRAAGSVLASDAFFPKADGVQVAARAGVRAIVQPGGSRGDPEVIAAADEAGMAMVFTGKRHFLH
jgi:phosphoribosylaminoimidazolecarboxamide formyltransferase/IMP cyclohydrolase